MSKIIREDSSGFIQLEDGTGYVILEETGGVTVNASVATVFVEGFPATVSVVAPGVNMHKLAPFLSTDVIGTPGYRIYEMIDGVATPVASRVTVGIGPLPGAKNAYGADVLVTANQPDGSFKGFIKWDTGETTFTGTTTSGLPTVTGITSTSGYQVGEGLSAGSGIPDNAVIQSVDSSTQVTMSVNATATGSRTLTRAMYFWDELLIPADVLAQFQADQDWQILLAGVEGRYTFSPPSDLPGTGTLVLKDVTGTTTLRTATLQFDSNGYITSKTVV